MSQYKTIKTLAGLALEAAAETGGPAIKLVSMSIGDGGGQAYSPSSTQTALRHEVDRVNLNSLSQNQDDATQWVAEGVFPADRGGYTIRELGLWTEEGVLFAIANFPDTYKPAPSEGTAGQMLLGLTFRAQNSDNITLVVDSSLLMASRDWVNENFLSGVTGQAPGDIRGIGLHTNHVTGRPSYIDGSGARGDLAFITDVQAETVRAQSAEAGLLPKTGGTISGNLSVSGNVSADTITGTNDALDIIYGDGNRLSLQNDGNFVGYDKNRKILYALNAGGGAVGGKAIATTDDVQAETARAQAAEANLVSGVQSLDDYSLKITGIKSQYRDKGKTQPSGIEYIDSNGLYQMAITKDYADTLYAGIPSLQAESSRAQAAESKLVSKNEFESDLSENGWIKIPGGLIFQWMRLDVTKGNYKFPKPFPNRAFQIFATNINAQGAFVDNAYAYIIDNSTFYCATKASNDAGIGVYPCSIFAIGI
ncbi:phage tail protein [Acetobacteraceae bacterium ESL0709]|nr:phage tail protein [Acetobacteraceae bacterium ESL0697]MDF7677400.1 phage tail protein [Acetobacteraceae bacterium ESL0709]